MTDLTKLTIAEAREGLKNKDYTSLELTDAFLANIEAANKQLNAYICRYRRPGAQHGESLR